MTDSHHSPIVIYENADHAVEVRLDTEQETLWLTQAQMGELFGVKPQNITMHLKNIYGEGELEEAATCKDFLQVQSEGNREVKRKGHLGVSISGSSRSLADNMICKMQDLTLSRSMQNARLDPVTLSTIAWVLHQLAR